MIAGEGQSGRQKKKRITKRNYTAANKKMECPAGGYFPLIWSGTEDVGMSELPVQQAQEPTTNQSDSYSAANANLGSIRFSDIHEYGAD